MLIRLKQDAHSAFKQRQKLKTELLRTLIGECSKDAILVDGVKTVEDTKVIAVIKKFIDNAKVMIEKGNVDAAAKASAEVDILTAYLPKQMDEADLRLAIKSAIELGSTNIGQAMNYLKNTCPGRYDGGLASKIARELLG